MNKRSNRWLLPVIVIVLAAGSAARWILVRALTPARLVAGPMVQLVTERGFTVVGELNRRQPLTIEVLTSAGERVGGFPAALDGARFEAAIGGLSAASDYEYRVAVAGQSAEAPPLASSRVRTAPTADGTFRLLAFGDSGSGDAKQYEVAALMTAQKPDLVVHVGDLVYPDGERKDYAPKFYKPYAELIARVPFYPCIGNHDFTTEQGAPLLENFVLPRNGPAGQTPERHYWFDFGPVRFVAIDTDLSQSVLADAVAPWLDRVLAEAGDRWKIVFFHHPVVTGGKYEPTYRVLQTIVPIMETHGVELVLSGHNHMYERSHPIRDGRVVEDGTGVVYVVTGAGGDELYELRPTPTDQLAVQNNTVHSYTLVDISPRHMVLTQIDDRGRNMDQYEFKRGSDAAASQASIRRAMAARAEAGLSIHSVR